MQGKFTFRAAEQPLDIGPVLAFIIGGLIVWQHRANIKRLLSGTESKFSLHKKKQG